MITELTPNLLAFVAPEGAKDFYVNGYEDHICFTPKHTPRVECTPLPSGNWRLISASEMTEEVAARYMENLSEQECRLQPCYKDYIRYGTIKKEPGKISQFLGFEEALESLSSLCESKGLYLKNPMGEEPMRRTPFKHAGYYTERDYNEIKEYKKELKLWKEAQSKVPTHFLVK